MYFCSFSNDLLQDANITFQNKKMLIFSDILYTRAGTVYTFTDVNVNKRVNV